MARGVIKKKPIATELGRIIVIDPISSSGTTDPSREAIEVVAVKLGQVVDYNEASASEVGDVVEFAYDGREASHLAPITKCTIITGTYQPDITINKDEYVLLNTATLNGVLITVNGGNLIVINNTVIKGRIVSTVDGSSVAISDGTQMNGNFEFSGASSFSLTNSTSQGSIESNGSTYVSVTGCTIKGKLEVLNAKSCNCSGNTVSGGTNTPGCTA